MTETEAIEFPVKQGARLFWGRICIVTGLAILLMTSLGLFQAFPPGRRGDPQFLTITAIFASLYVPLLLVILNWKQFIVFDRERQEIVFRSVLLGRATDEKICQFSDVRGVFVQKYIDENKGSRGRHGKRAPCYYSRLELFFGAEECLPLSDHVLRGIVVLNDKASLEDRAKKLCDACDLPYHSSSGDFVEVSVDGTPALRNTTEHSGEHVNSSTSRFTQMFFASVALAFALLWLGENYLVPPS